MAKGRSTGVRSPRVLRIPAPVRIREHKVPSIANKTIEDLLAIPGKVRRPGNIAIYSGVGQHSPAIWHHTNLPQFPLPGWGMMRIGINAPPPGAQILWLTLDWPTTFWFFNGGELHDPKNTSGHFRYTDFHVTWRWMLLVDPYVIPDGPACMQDWRTYELYASNAPGSNEWIARWHLPSRSVTLTPSDKESDPNTLALLLRSEQSGLLRLNFTYNMKFMWTRAASWGPEPDILPSTLHYSMAVELPKSAVAPNSANDIVDKSIGRSKSKRR